MDNYIMCITHTHTHTHTHCIQLLCATIQSIQDAATIQVGIILLVIGMVSVQLQFNHKSLPKESKILSECKARG